MDKHVLYSEKSTILSELIFILVFWIPGGSIFIYLKHFNHMIGYSLIGLGWGLVGMYWKSKFGTRKPVVLASFDGQKIFIKPTGWLNKFVCDKCDVELVTISKRAFSGIGTSFYLNNGTVTRFQLNGKLRNDFVSFLREKVGLPVNDYC